MFRIWLLGIYSIEWKNLGSFSLPIELLVQPKLRRWQENSLFFKGRSSAVLKLQGQGGMFEKVGFRLGVLVQPEAIVSANKNVIFIFENNHMVLLGLKHVAPVNVVESSKKSVRATHATIKLPFGNIPFWLVFQFESETNKQTNKQTKI